MNILTAEICLQMGSRSSPDSYPNRNLTLNPQHQPLCLSPPVSAPRAGRRAGRTGRRRRFPRRRHRSRSPRGGCEAAASASHGPRGCCSDRGRDADDRLGEGGGRLGGVHTETCLSGLFYRALGGKISAFCQHAVPMNIIQIVSSRGAIAEMTGLYRPDLT